MAAKKKAPAFKFPGWVDAKPTARELAIAQQAFESGYEIGKEEAMNVTIDIEDKIGQLKVSPKDMKFYINDIFHYPDIYPLPKETK